MSPETIIAISVFVIVYAGDKILSYFKSRGIDLQKMSAQIGELHEWHDMVDDEGVKIWYSRKSLEKAVIKLSDNIEKQTEVLREIHVDQVASRIQLKEIDRKVSNG